MNYERWEWVREIVSWESRPAGITMARVPVYGYRLRRRV